MGAIEIIVVVGVVAGAIAFLVTRVFRRGRKKVPGCGCGPKDCPAGRR